MGKYAQLGPYLMAQPAAEVPMTFSEVERVIGMPLPTSAKYPAWWSNNPSNNVMTKVWLEAGFQTERVDTTGRKLVFRRLTASPKPGQTRKAAAPPHLAEERTGVPRRHPIFGAMRGLMVVPDDLDLTQPADPEWADIVEGKGA